MTGDTKFTPGPWCLINSGYGLPADISRHRVSDETKGLTIATIIEDVAELPGESNAHLIAAAPELYDAVEQALKVLDTAKALASSVSDDEWIYGLESDWKGLLAKARGEQ